MTTKLWFCRRLFLVHKRRR